MSVFKDEIKQIAKDFGAEHGISILYIDTDGWVPKEPVHPLRVNHKIAAEKLCTILKEHFNL